MVLMKMRRSKPSLSLFQKQSRGLTPDKYKPPFCPYEEDKRTVFFNLQGWPFEVS
jgi:hypothetical protein